MGKERTSKSVVIPTGTGTDAVKTYKLELITETLQGDVQGNTLNYVLIEGLYHLLRIENNQVYIDKESYSEAELVTPENDENPEITLQVNNLPSLVKFKNVGTGVISEVINSTIIHKNDEVYVYTQSTPIEDEASISVSIQKQQTPFEIAVSIINIIPATAVSINNTSEDLNNHKWTIIYSATKNNVTSKYMAINTDQEVSLTKTLTPAKSNEIINWSSSNTTIASVDENGKVTGKKAGNVEITATAEVSGKSDKVIVTVTEYGEIVDYSVTVGSTTLDNWKIFYKENGNTFLIYGDYLPNSVLNETIIYNNQNTTIATLTGMSTGGEYRTWWKSVPQMQSIGNNVLTLFKGKLSDSYDSSKCVSTLLQTEFWEYLITGDLKSINENIMCIGSPTLEMWLSSYNQIYIWDDYKCDYKTTGYQIWADYQNNWNSFTWVKQKDRALNRLYFPRIEEVSDPRT